MVIFHMKVVNVKQELFQYSAVFLVKVCTLCYNFG